MLQEEIFQIAHCVAGCPHTITCQNEFTAKGNSRREQWSLADIPSPDFIGSNYQGLLVVAGNPGLAHHPVHFDNDEKMFNLQKRIAIGDRFAFNELMKFMPESMRRWPQMVNDFGRDILDYDIEDIAYVELVKCGTRPGRGDTHSLFRGTGILERCWDTHTSRLLKVLKPTHIVTLWKPLGRVLDRLGFQRAAIPFGTYNGRRTFTAEKRYAEARMPFDLYYGRTP